MADVRLPISPALISHVISFPYLARILSGMYIHIAANLGARAIDSLTRHFCVDPLGIDEHT